MHCTNCAAEVPEQRKFCGQCGAALSRRCPVCGAANPALSKFCGDCGTGLFYTNEQIFPGKIDVQIATLDDPDLIPAQAQIQTAERIGWMERLNELPIFERYPG